MLAFTLQLCVRDLLSKGNTYATVFSGSGIFSALPTLTKNLKCLHYLGCCSVKMLEILHDDKLCQASNIPAGYGDLYQLFTGVKKKKKVFSSFEWEALLFTHPVLTRELICITGAVVPSQ